MARHDDSTGKICFPLIENSMKYTIEYCPFDSAIFEMKWGRIQFHDYDLNEQDFSEILFQIKDEEYE